MRILVVKLSSLGDLMHALPAVHNLKVGLSAEVDWVTQPEYVDLARCFEDVANVIPFPRREPFAKGVEFVRRLRLRRYDLVIDFQGLLKSALICGLARARRILGPSFRREGTGLLYHAVAGPRNKERHAVEENLDVVRFLGLDVLPAAFPLRVTKPAGLAAHPRVAVLPISRHANKNWPEERFMEVVRWLRRERGAQVFCLGGKADQAVCDEIVRAVNTDSGGPPVTDLAGRTSLVDMAGLLGGMDLVIGNDSGPIHVAAALGVPVLAIFGPTDPRRTGPYGDRHRVVVGGEGCRPCHRRECVHVTPHCLDKLTVDRVLEAAGAMLENRVAGGAGTP